MARVGHRACGGGGAALSVVECVRDGLRDVVAHPDATAICDAHCGKLEDGVARADGVANASRDTYGVGLRGRRAAGVVVCGDDVQRDCHCHAFSVRGGNRLAAGHGCRHGVNLSCHDAVCLGNDHCVGNRRVHSIGHRGALAIFISRPDTLGIRHRYCRAVRHRSCHAVGLHDRDATAVGFRRRHTDGKRHAHAVAVRRGHWLWQRHKQCQRHTRADAVALHDALLARLDDAKTALDTIVREAREHHRESMNANDQLNAMMRQMFREVHDVRAALGGGGGTTDGTDGVVARPISLAALDVDWDAPLGSGAYGDVFKGVWSHGGDTRAVAVKRFHTEGRLADKERVKVLREVGVLCRLGNAHPNVIQVCVCAFCGGG